MTEVGLAYSLQVIRGQHEDPENESVGGTLLTHHPTPCCTDRKPETWRCGGLAPGRKCNTVARAGISFPAGPLHSKVVGLSMRQITALSLSLSPQKLRWH